MSEDQSRLCSPRQTEAFPSIGLRIERLACFDQQQYGTLVALPFPHVVTGIPVGQAGLAEHCVLKRQLSGMFDRFDQTPVNAAQP
ncbi:MAG: hypothetical protein ACREFT_00895 [Acetobacteraceae bacterium]